MDSQRALSSSGASRSSMTIDADRFLPGLMLTRSASALSHRDLQKNAFLKLPARDRNFVSTIRNTLESGIDKDLRIGVLNLPSPSPRVPSAVHSLMSHSWPPEGYRSIGINNRVKSSHGKYSGNITNASLITCDRAFRANQRNELSVQFCDILGPYACADCTRKRKFVRCHDAVIPAEMDEDAITPLARMEKEAAFHQKKLLDRRRRVMTSTERRVSFHDVPETDEEDDEVLTELQPGLPIPRQHVHRRGTMDMFRSLVKFTRYASAFTSYKGDIDAMGPPLARTGAFRESTG